MRNRDAYYFNDKEPDTKIEILSVTKGAGVVEGNLPRQQLSERDLTEQLMFGNNDIHREGERQI